MVPKWFPSGSLSVPNGVWFPVPIPLGNRNHRQWFPGTTQTEGTTRSTNTTQEGSMMHILAIDPGNTESGYALIDSTNCRPLAIGKKENNTLRKMILGGQFSDVDHISIEMIKSYGMPVGATVFETCVWIGRYLELLLDLFVDVDLVYRGDVKQHHCHNSGAKDSNVIVALTDRFASGVRNRGKGTVASPGWFYGFKADIWQAYALAVFTADTINAVDVPAGAHVREVAAS